MRGEKQSYIIFARKKYDEPLAEIGTITAKDNNAASQAALDAYPDGDWLEMVAIPERAIVHVMEGEPI